MRSTARPEDLASLLAGAPFPWWVAGGWAIDLFLGRSTREHEDLDVAILRRDAMRARSALREFDVHAGHGAGVVEPTPLAADDPTPAVPALWVRRRSWLFELLLSEADGDVWSFKRDARVRRPVSSLAAPGVALPILAPEIVLLHKAARLEPRDEDDARAALPVLAPGAARWLRDALRVAHPGHAWLRRLPAERAVEPLCPWETLPLRQRVLRPHVAAEALVLPHDDADGSGHFGAFEGDALVATATVVRLPSPEPGFSPWRLRAVAVAPEARGKGHGRRVVEACLQHARERGAGMVWWNAAPDVAAWYERMGARRHGEVARRDGGTDVRLSFAW